VHRAELRPERLEVRHARRGGIAELPAADEERGAVDDELGGGALATEVWDARGVVGLGAGDVPARQQRQQRGGEQRGEARRSAAKEDRVKGMAAPWQ
jgi:hypothetical protein